MKNMTGCYICFRNLRVRACVHCAWRCVTYNDWKHRHQEAALSLGNCNEKLDAIYEEIERDMTLIVEWLLPKKECRFFMLFNGAHKWHN